MNLPEAIEYANNVKGCISNSALAITLLHAELIRQGIYAESLEDEIEGLEKELREVHRDLICANNELNDTSRDSGYY